MRSPYAPIVVSSDNRINRLKLIIAPLRTLDYDAGMVGVCLQPGVRLQQA